MRKSKEETAKTRERIVDSAAAEFRRSGIAETGLNELMASAGLTHGGFYRHFESKDHLIAEACQRAFADILDGMESLAAAKPPGDALEAVVAHYLSPRQRDNPANGCPLAALGSDLRRADANTRDIASDGYLRLVEIVRGQIEALPPREAKARATAIVSAMVGAMILARVVNDTGTSNRILKDTRDFILHSEPTNPLEASR